MKCETLNTIFFLIPWPSAPSPSCFPSLTLCQLFVPCSSLLCGTLYLYLSLHAALLLTLSTFIYLCPCCCCLADVISVAVLESRSESCSVGIKASEEVETGHDKILPQCMTKVFYESWSPFLEYIGARPHNTVY